MRKQKNRPVAAKILSLALALVFVLNLAACGGNGRQNSNDSSGMESSQGDGVFRFMNPLGYPDEMDYYLNLPSFMTQISEAYEINSDVVGWLSVPGTTIDDAVLFYPNEDVSTANTYYARRNLEKKTSKEGCYYADFRSTFDGTAEGLTRNMVIYGHSLDMHDDPNAPYFSQLKKYLDQDFAEEHPYIYFSTLEEDLVWEVFAVFYATVNLPYNTPEMANEQFMDLISEATKRSEYIYDVNVTANDKIITLSTCTYVFTPGVYPNDYRYVVMAKLVEDGEPFKERAVLEKNLSRKEP